MVRTEGRVWGAPGGGKWYEMEECEREGYTLLFSITQLGALLLFPVE